MTRMIGLLSLLLAAPAAHAAFPDVHQTSPYYDAILYMQSEGIVHGHADGTYQPGHGINRAEFTKILVEATMNDADIAACNTSDVSFSDVPADAWFAPYVCAAFAAGIVEGYPDGSFGPSAAINVAEAAKIIVATDTGELSGDPWYQPYVTILGLKAALPTEIASLSQELSRGQMAEIMYRLETGTTTKASKNYEELSGDASASIVATAQATADLSTLVTAVVAADLVDTLSGEGPFTVFAPTNAAFADIQSTVDLLLQAENLADLQGVLTYHVVAGAVLSSDLSDGQTIETVNGATLTVDIRENGDVYINDAKVTAANVATGNGIVHVIDAVLVPGADTGEGEEEEEAGSMTIVATAQATADLSTLVTAVVAADLVDTLSGEGPFTVFAPSNAAFAEIQSTVDGLLQPEYEADLRNLLTYHVVADSVLSSELSDGQTLTTVQGQELTVSIVDGQVRVNGQLVVTADVEASNGVVHIIDGVLIPSAE